MVSFIQAEQCEGFDLIGDIHGCGTTLIALLEKLGYRHEQGSYRHPRRVAIFLGDLIDRGPTIRLALQVVRRMVDAGAARVVMGNHEVHALRHCLDDSGRVVTPREPHNARILHETLQQFSGCPREWADYLHWFLRMPLCLEYDGCRVVHACWDESLLRPFLQRYPDGRIDQHFLAAARQVGSFEQRTLDRVTRGVHLPLPQGRAIRSADGSIRHTFRAHFWAIDPITYGDVVFQPDPLPRDLEARALGEYERQRLVHYGPDERPLFIGHYWCEGIPALPAANIACLDYSAVRCGRLVAYRFDGHAALSADRLVWLSPGDEISELEKNSDIRSSAGNF
ncbi:metallophosphoesterase [Kushneria phosphatilytica]|uniref:Serine/threonine protein phosphatase n=1 Tax=Kushneria phosphatilytica TaxID=657387 RepID=A0A1S1P0B7_9GAMM|nr:metallophosphoesterase [Kushneria phosphatilytica]OHV12888.1 serine/threonine protein phosphatase [Kushneria phosphatilytica]QEL10746.1 serine/threonine protein phosphatase [Kushneria phosphatilytica]